MSDYLNSELNEWLRQHRALRIADGQVGEQHHDLYAVNERLIIIATYCEDQGQVCEIFIPAATSYEFTDTLKAVEVACGINV